MYLPPPSTVPPPPSPPRPSSATSRSGEVDLHLLGLDPLNWKRQDHYLLLGLQDKRHQATAAEIKTAYRQRCLQYHPDKLQQQSSSPLASAASIQDNIFKCLFQAYQVLSDPEKRKQYDSVDANAFDESIPAEDAVSAGDIDIFLALYRPVFVRNARFSKKQPVPDIGHAFSPREDVETFYAFWSTFESWRSFDYLDEDEAENPENRADKRWLEKKNKANRMKRKNEDNARLRRLFEQAYKLDPRLVRFREDDRLRKEAIKMEKEMAALRLSQEKAREKLEAELKVKQEKERLEAEKAEAKKQKEAIEAKVRRDKKTFKKLLSDQLYFVNDKTNLSLINERSILIERILALKEACLDSLLNELQERLNHGQTEEIFEWFQSEIEQDLASKRQSNNSASSARSMEASSVETTVPWTLSEIDTLINAIKTHPGGLRERWTRITEWYNRHISHLDHSLPRRDQEELIKRAAEIKQTTDEGQASSVVPSEATTDYRALQKKRDPRIDQAEPSLNINNPIVVNSVSGWSAEEQKRLEQGLKIHKADDLARWDKIAEFVGRPKKDCMLRAKEIALMLKQKKASS